MKFEITLYDNNDKEVFVKPEKTFKKNLFIIEEKGSLVDINAAKTVLGDWTKNDDYFEIERRKSRAISHFELILKHGTQTFHKKKLDIYNEVEEKEDVFVEIKKKNDELIKPVKCSATTKSGNPCKSNALNGSEFCLAHKK